MSASRSARRATTLNADYYNSPEIFRLETERIFDRHWRCLGRETEIALPRRFTTLQMDGESLILLRDNDDIVRCFFNVCRHRGTRLCETSSGEVGQTIVCPYHAWSYGLAGELRAAPNMTDVADFDPTAFGLKQVATATWGGFVFLNFTGDLSFRQAFAHVPTMLDRWAPADLVCVARRDYEVRANWKLLFQNYNECYHCPRVHPVLNSLSSYTTATNDLEEGPFLGGPMELSEGVSSMTTTRATCAPVLPGLSDSETRQVYYYSMFPTMLISPHPDFVLVHRIERAGIGVTRVVCEFLFHPHATEDPAFDPTPAVQFWDETNQQDWHVCELSQQGISSRAYQPGPYSNLESTVAAFDRYYLQVLNGAA